MGKNCIYCNLLMEEVTPIDVCNACGYQVWGEKMFSAIKDNMEKAEKSGDLNQGSISQSSPSPEPLRSEKDSSEFEFKTA